MEWTGSQQLALLMESGGLGLVLGVLFDVNSGLSRATPGRRAVHFLQDTGFGLLAALITFYASLAIMDGQMHPLLFCGSGAGFWLEHISVGRFMAMLSCRIRSAWRQCSRRLLVGIESLLVANFAKISACFCRKKPCNLPVEEENTKNSEKKRKKYAFFQKKS